MTTETNEGGKAGAAHESRRGAPGGGVPGAGSPGAGPLLLNRELSLIEFFRRVLEEGLDASQPLLERLKFLAIFSSNLDEFFMIRVSGLKERVEEGVDDLSPDGMSPAEQLSAIREALLPLVAEQARCYRGEMLPALKAEGIEVARYDRLTLDERRALNEYFNENVYPVLTPQAVDPAHPFPFISNLSLNIGLMVEPVPEHGITRSLTGKVEPRFARVKIPPVVPRLVPVGGSKTRFVLIEELVSANLDALFPRMRTSEYHAFRVTRDGEVEIREDEADDLLRCMEESLRRRRRTYALRLEVSAKMPAGMVDYLSNSLGVSPDDVYVIDGALNLPDLMALYKLDRPDLKDRPLKPTVPAALRDEGRVFEAVARQDVLLHHPYTSYSTVVNFIRQAAKDPDVLAIKICLYRTGSDSAIPEALIEASARGKQVTALVELKARFDEENNIEWAERLKEAGVHVVYGVVGLKTHCKVALVVRREGRMRRYVHVATGNYNPTTSAVYTDLGLLTADDEIGADTTDLFNFLTGFSRHKEYRRMLVAPSGLRGRMIELIERETEHQLAGRPAAIRVKVNRLADTEVIRALYRASQAGVRIDLVVRSVCTLRPGVPGLSETIRVRSVVGRFLEHSRVFYFRNGGDEELYTGSADWMPRNFDRRVEVVVPVKDPSLKKYLRDVVLAAYLRDNVKARRLLPDGSYERVRPAPGEELFSSQEYFEGSVSIGP